MNQTTTPTTYNELALLILKVLPNAIFDETSDGELTIATGLRLIDDNGMLRLIAWEPGA